MKRSTLRSGWLVCCALVLATVLYLFDGTPTSDADIILAYGMLLLALPVSLLVAAAATLMGQVLHAQTGYVFEVSYSCIFVAWACFTLAGYWQWFVLVPKLLDAYRSRREKR